MGTQLTYLFRIFESNTHHRNYRSYENKTMIEITCFELLILSNRSNWNMPMPRSEHNWIVWVVWSKAKKSATDKMQEREWETEIESERSAREVEVFIWLLLFWEMKFLFWWRLSFWPHFCLELCCSGTPLPFVCCMYQ